MPTVDAELPYGPHYRKSLFSYATPRFCSPQHVRFGQLGSDQVVFVTLDEPSTAEGSAGFLERR